MPNPVCPFARQHILHGEEDRRPTITPIATALHTAVTAARGDRLGVYFDRESIKNDSTFYVDRDGTLWQFGPVNRKANAQFAGNAFRLPDGRLGGTVSIETWDGGDPSKPLNVEQLATLIKLYAWLATEWGISLDASRRWNGPGAGWHSKYPEWNENAHACPGPVRVKQLLELILPGAQRLNTTPTPEEIDMTKDQATQLAEVHEMLLGMNHQIVSNEGRLYRAVAAVERVEKALGNIKAAVDRIVKKLGA